MYKLAIDFGSSSARIVLYKNNKFKEVARFGHEPCLINGHFRWDIVNLFDKVQAEINKAITIYDIDNIGICSWGVDYGLIDNKGKLYDLPYCYRDGRNEEIFNNLHSKYDNYKLFEQTGIYPNKINTLYQLLADIKEQRYKVSEHLQLLLIADLFAYRLTGNAYCEISNASTTQLLNLAANDWNYTLINQLGINKNLFCPLIKAGNDYGMYKGIKVKAVLTHDTASAVYAMNCEEDNTAFISSGSWILFGVLLDKPIINAKAYQYRYTNERGYNNKVTFLNNGNGLFIIQRLVKELNLTYKDIDLNVEYAKFLGELDIDQLHSPTDMLGQILAQLNITKAKPMDLIKTVYDNLAIKLKENIEQLETITTKRIEAINLSGGLTKAPYFMEKFKELTNIEPTIIISEGAIAGNIKILENYC